jgi:Secretion system C-terminal sorting domain
MCLSSNPAGYGHIFARSGTLHFLSRLRFMQHLHFFFLRGILSLCFVSAAFGSAQGQSYTFYGLKWNNPNSWIPSFVPPSGASNLSIVIGNSCGLDVDYTLGPGSTIGCPTHQFSIENSRAFTIQPTATYASQGFGSMNVLEGGSVNNQGTMNIQGEYGLIVRGNLQNNGTINHTSPLSVFVGSLTNNGTINTQDAQLRVAAGATLTNNATITNFAGKTLLAQGTFANAQAAAVLHNYGLLDLQSGGVVNHSEGILYNYTGGTVDVTTGSTLNNANASLENNGGTVQVAGTLNITTASKGVNNPAAGTVHVLAGGTIALSNGFLSNAGQLNNAGTISATGGNLSITDGTLTTNGVVSLNGGTGQNSEVIQVTGGSFGTGGTHSFVNTMDGAIQISAGATANLGGDFQNNGTINNSGTLTVPAGGIFSQNNTLLQTGIFTINGTFTGHGGVTGQVTNNGTIAPKGAAGNIGTMHIAGDLVQNATSLLAFEIGGSMAGQSDKIAVTGSATLGGSIQVSLVNGYTPANCAEFEVMAFGSYSGVFSGISGLNSDWSVIYTPNSIKIKYHGTAKTFVGGGANDLWSNPDNWAECLAPTGTVQQNVTIAAPCSLDVNIAMNANLTIGANHSFALLAGYDLTINSGSTFTCNGVPELTGHLNVQGTAHLNTGAQILGGQLTVGGIVHVAQTFAIQDPGSNLTISSGGTLNNSGSMLLAPATSTLQGSIHNATGGQLFWATPTTHNGTLTNNGAVRLDVSGNWQNTGTITNNGTAVFDIGQPTRFVSTGLITNAANANLAAFAGAALTLAGTISNAGTITFNNGTSIYSDGALTNTGTITNVSNFFCSINSVLTNNGTINENGYMGNLGLIQGTGTFTGAFWQNQGTLAPGNSPGTITMNNGNYAQTGVLNIELGSANAGNYDVVAASGTLIIDDVLNITLINGFVPAVCTEFEIMTCANRDGTFATVNWPAGTNADDWAIVYNNTSVKIRYGAAAQKVFDGGGLDDNWTTHDNWVNCVSPTNVNTPTSIESECILNVAVNNTSTLTILPGKTLIFNNFTLNNQPSGILSLQGTLDQTQGNLAQNGTLTGNGVFVGHLTNNGTVQPGNPYGALTVQGDYTQSAAGALEIQLNGTGGYDQLLVSGAANLAGSLQVGFANGFTPAACNEFVLMTYASRVGQFDVFAAPGLPAHWKLEYGPTQLKLKYVNAPVRTFVGTVNNLWSNDANWLECKAPEIESQVPVIIAADCVLDVELAMFANLTIQSGKKMTIEGAGALQIQSGATLINQGILDNKTNVTVLGTMNFSPSTSYINEGNFSYENTAVDAVPNGAIQNSGLFTLNVRSVDIQTNIHSTGSGSLVIDATENITLQAPHTVSAVNGTIEWKANESGSSTNFGGIAISGASVTTSGTGHIAMYGKGGPHTASLTGFFLSNSGAKIETTGSGNISITGIGGTNSTVSSPNHGAFIGTGALVKTAAGNIDIIGTGPTTPNADNTSGIHITGGTVEAGGAGSVDLEGTGVVGGGNITGCYMGNGAKIQTTDGSLQIRGHGGAGANGTNCGIWFAAGGGMETYARVAGTGELNLTGEGGDGGQNNHGIFIDGVGGSGRTLEATSNLIVLSAQGGTGTGNAAGLRVNGSTFDSEIKALASANVQMAATGGTGGDQNNGVHLSGKIGADAGNINIVANAGTGNSHGFYHQSGEAFSNTGSFTVQATGSGNGTAIRGENATFFGKSTTTGLITLICDGFEGAGLRSAGTAIIRPRTPSTTIGLGDGTPGSLHFSAQETQNFLVEKLILGDAAAGTGLVSVNTNMDVRSDVHFIGGQVEVGQIQAQFNGILKNVDFSARTGHVKGMGVNFNTSLVTGNSIGVSTPNGQLRPGNSPGIFQVSGNYAQTGNLEIELEGTNGAGQVNGHDQLRTGGGSSQITLGGTLTVEVINGFVPTIGQTFVIVDASLFGGTITGTFDNIVSPGYQWSISYSPTQVILNFVVLPVELLDFTAQNEEKTVLLQWSTATEVNADRFEVEHSADGLHFQSFGTVQAVGHSASLQRYQLRHTQPVPGLNYYRLRQVDRDGRAEYSPIAAVNRSVSAEADWLVFPNPAPSNAVLTVWLSEQIGASATATLSDITGRQVLEAKVEPGHNTLVINTLPDGVYFLKIGTLSRRVVVGGE